ncbi:MAG: replicative DNA helicase [Chlamydiales bacterium]|nr:replicative DNA helicase [Chlamydiales bacterium]
MTEKIKDPKTLIQTLPNSKESEMMVLGCMLTSVNSLNIAADALYHTDFYYSEHQLIFKTLKTAYQSDKPADIHLISEELKRQGELKAVGGVAYLTTLAQYATTSAYIDEYVDLIKNKSILRRMIEVAKKIEKESFEEKQEVNTLLDEAQAMFFTISQSANAAVGIHIKDLLSGMNAESKLPYLKELQEKQEEYYKRGSTATPISGIPTQFADLDKLINGLNQANLLILAARPSMGKTAFALNIAENICFKQHKTVGIFSLEMTAEELIHRMICSQSEVESEKIKAGSLDGIEYQRIVAAVNAMQKHTLIIDDQPGLKVTDLRARARRLKEIYNVELIVIDYLQLLSGSRSNYSPDNRQNEISEISRMLKNLARELKVPIICLSQLSRKVEERSGHRPMLSDLRESGCLVGNTQIQDATTGQFYTIKELATRKVQTPITVYAIDDTLKIGKHQMTKAFYSGKKVVYELRTRSGRTISASANHPFRKLNGWVALESLSAGDRIAIPRTLSSQEKTSDLEDNELTFLAHLLGDGCILPNQPYHYTSADESNINTVNQCTSSLFEISPKTVRQKNWYHSYFPSPYHLTHGKYHPITLWFNKLGIERVRSYEKRIPDSIFGCNENKISLFLHHLWATDGNISLVKNKGKSPGAAIYYASSSYTLSHQVQALLLRIGIPSTLATVPSNKGYRNMHHVHVQSAPHQKVFLSKVGSAGKRGEIVPSLLQLLEQTIENPNTDTIPAEAWDLFIKPAKEQSKLSWRELCHNLGMSYCGSSLFKSGLSRRRMNSLANICSSQTLLNLAQSDVYWDEVTSIEKKDLVDVYDATVENVHNFVANDIIVHNSIEQDSDIVMFLFRPEYYNPQHKPGVAELIVAKNRHGKVGNVNLTFRKSIAQFQNYTPIDDEPAMKNDSAFAAFSPDN